VRNWRDIGHLIRIHEALYLGPPCRAGTVSFRGFLTYDSNIYRAGEKTYPYIDEKESYRRYGPDPTRRPATAGDRRIRKSHLALDIKKAGEDWGKSFVPESPPPISTPNFGDILHTGSNVKLQRNSIQLQQRKPPAKISRTESSPDVRTGCTAKAAADVSFDNTYNSRSPRTRHGSISSTILRSTFQTPITIVVTTPEDELQDNNESYPWNGVHTHKNPSVVSLPSFSTPATIDTNLLMPPTDNQIDPRKLHRAQEFRQMRSFLINFMNAKGDQFPHRLRAPMMELYMIRDIDLRPEVVAKFNAEVQDEGVALDKPGDDPLSNAESLRILGAAFQSHVPELKPKKRPADVRPPMQRRQSSPPRSGPMSYKPSPPSSLKSNPSLKDSRAAKERKSLDPSSPKTTPRNSLKSPQQTPPSTPPSPKKSEFQKHLPLPKPSPLSKIEEDNDDYKPPSWMAPMISTTSKSRDSVLSDPAYLKSTQSTPDLHGGQRGSRPELPRGDSSPSVPTMTEKDRRRLEKLAQGKGKKGKGGLLSRIFH
jgi:hypothetical protein